MNAPGMSKAAEAVGIWIARLCFEMNETLEEELQLAHFTNKWSKETSVSLISIKSDRCLSFVKFNRCRSRRAIITGFSCNI